MYEVVGRPDRALVGDPNTRAITEPMNDRPYPTNIFVIATIIVHKFTYMCGIGCKIACSDQMRHCFIVAKKCVSAVCMLQKIYNIGQPIRSRVLTIEFNLG